MSFEVCELYVPKSPEDFIEKMAADGRAWATKYNYPLAAMIACACAESGFGTSSIYKMTGCPFNLQKPSHWTHPKCRIRHLQTINKVGEKAKLSPFCCADNLSDAARLWCEWINFFPNPGPKATLEGFRGDAKLFAANLHLVVFAEGKKENTKKFADVITQKDLLKYQ